MGDAWCSALPVKPVPYLLIASLDLRTCWTFILCQIIVAYVVIIRTTIPSVWILDGSWKQTKQNKKKPLQELRRAVATWKDTLTWPSQASYLLQMQKSFTHLKLMCLLTLYHSRPPDNIDFLPYQKLQIEIKVRTQLIDKAMLENQVGY